MCEAIAAPASSTSDSMPPSPIPKIHSWGLELGLWDLLLLLLLPLPAFKRAAVSEKHACAAVPARAQDNTGRPCTHAHTTHGAGPGRGGVGFEEGGLWQG
jgi:hypothetical protein